MHIAVAVDTCVLLDRADNNETTIDALHTIFERAGVKEIGLPPTVSQELDAIRLTGDAEEKRLAEIALESLLEWGFKPFDLIAVGHGIVDEISWAIRVANLLPEEEVNDSYIISECALAGFSLLVSPDGHMIDAQRSGQLQKLLDRYDVNPLMIISPIDLVRQFFRRR